MSIHVILYTFISSFMALFPVINPIGNSIIINGWLEGLNGAQRKAAIKKIVLNCMAVGIGSLVLGHLLLLIFDLAIPVIQIGGGVLICKTGWEWLSDSKEAKDKETASMKFEDIEGKLFYPISFPISMGPGSISIILTLIASVTVKGNLFHTVIGYSLIGLAIIAVCILFYILMIQGRKVMRGLGNSVNIIVNKLVAFFMFCIGMQIMFSGISNLFNLNLQL